MKDFEKLIKQCTEELQRVGIYPGRIIEWKVNNRAKSRWGLCRKNKQGCIIEISKQLLTDDRISEQACKETILHELLHSCPECSGHTGKWKEYAMLLNERYGYHIKRTTSGKEKGVENYTRKSMPVQYVLICTNCHMRIERKRMCKLVHYYRNYICGNCGRGHTFKRYDVVKN